LLGNECFTQLLCPGRLLSHHCEYLWEGRQGLHAQVPVHFVDGVIERIPLEVRILLQPAVRIHDLIREGRCHQNLRKQCIRVQRNRGKHLVKFCLA
jgi:hypothetical protein